MKKAIRNLILERDKTRGQVPSREDGHKDKVYGHYLTSLNPRENLDVQQALAESDDPRFVEFLDRIMSPQYTRMSLQTVAKGCNISLLEFNKWWGKASAQKAIAIAQMGSLAVTQDMVQDARSVESCCERCDGTLMIPAPAGMPPSTPGYTLMTGPNGETLYVRTCPSCQSGRVRKPGDQHSRDKILEMGGLIQKGKGLSVNLNFGATSHTSIINDLAEDTPIDGDYTVITP